MTEATTEAPSDSWPAWFYGPEGQEGVFHKAEDVPEGWVDHPAKVGAEPEAPKPPKLTAAEKKAAAAKEAEEKAAAAEGGDKPVEEGQF